MKRTIQNNKLTSFKSGYIPKYQKNQIQISKSINNLRTKTSHNFIRRKKKESESLNSIINSNKNERTLENLDNISDNNMVNNQTEKSFKIDNSLGEEREKRKIIIHQPLNLSQKFSSNIKLSLAKRKNIIPLYSINDINNNLLLNFRINSEDKIEKSKESTINVEKEINTYNYFKANKINMNNNDIKEKGFKNLTEGNINKNKNRKLYKNLFLKNNSRNGNNNIYSKNNSYDDSKNILSKIKIIKEKIINFSPCTYIKVKKNFINKVKTIEQNINNKKNNFYNLYNNINNKTFNNNTITIENLHKNKSQKLINLKRKNDYNYNNKKTKLAKKASKTTFDNNNNIFLDKTFQNRFKYQPKYIKLEKDIFANDKQKEYNTIVVKKRNNYLNNAITTSTTISSNSSNNNSSNIYNRNWVHRLYDEEIQKQKKRNKLINSLRKAILSNSSYNKPKKQLNKSNTLNNFNFNEYNDFKKDFNIINLFLSDEKKNNKKAYKHKKKNYILNDNNTNQNENNDEENKFKAVRRKRKSNSKYKKSQKNFIFINEELIHEEDEEKERDEDEK